jgi:hypothetical protein
VKAARNLPVTQRPRPPAQQIYTHVDEAARRDSLTKLNECSAAPSEQPAVVNGGQQAFLKIKSWLFCLVGATGIEPVTPRL